ncbi:MAG TPA: aspartate 1-decarboxylase [Thermoanaerobaculia bacterium]|jgi:aspartate 1-decarboxylase|nr:aspartate 1-decarboxylase [Thermoanaerobaculia bacterium]
MMRRLVRAVIRNATVTRSEGLTLKLDPVLLRAANILPLEEVEIVHHATAQRFVTFAESGAAGEVSVPEVRAGDVISIIAYGILHDGQTLAHEATLVTLAEANQIVAVAQARAVPV